LSVVSEWSATCRVDLGCDDSRSAAREYAATHATGNVNVLRICWNLAFCRVVDFNIGTREQVEVARSLRHVVRHWHVACHPSAYCSAADAHVSHSIGADSASNTIYGRNMFSFPGRKQSMGQVESSSARLESRKVEDLTIAELIQCIVLLQ
jgi:hypothetical protein